MHRYQASLNRKTQIKIGEEGHKIQSKKCLLSNKTGVKIKQEEQLTHEVTQQENTEAKTKKNCKFGRFLGQRGLALCFQGKRAL
jgi:hypothetical protein